MDIEYLHEFIVLAKKLNYHDAAVSLCISPSTLSKHVKSLEDYFGASLFVRNQHQTYLTEYGAYLFEHAESLWSVVMEARRVAGEQFSGSFVIRYACITFDASSDYPIMALTESYLKKVDPRYSVRWPLYGFSSAGELIEVLENEEIDCALAYDLHESIVGREEFAYERIYSIPLEATMSQSNPLACKQEIALESLQGTRLLHLAGPGYSVFWTQMKKHLSAKKVSYVEKPVTVTSPYASLNAISNIGDAIFIAPERCTPTVVLKNPNLITIPIYHDSCTIDLDLVVKSNDTREIIKVFSQALKRAYLETFEN